MLATGGSAAWQLLTENQYSDGRLSTLMNNANNVQPFIGQTFANSQNFLEDCLGQASAIALGLFWGYSSMLQIGGPIGSQSTPINPNDSEVYIVNGNASLEGVRVGSGSRIALLYILPEVFAAGLLIWLLFITRHLE
jgi:hypothetical protein